MKVVYTCTVIQLYRNHTLSPPPGKDLSRISMPVSLNEPLSALQRLCEEVQYSELLDQAAALDDPCDRMVGAATLPLSLHHSLAFSHSPPSLSRFEWRRLQCQRTSPPSTGLPASHSTPSWARPSSGSGRTRASDSWRSR